jgi:hypothetical protein
MRTIFGVLEEAIRAQPNIHLPDLLESFCEDLLCNNGNDEDYKQHLPPEFHDFIDTTWSEGEAETLTMSRITKADTRKFLDKSDKGYIIAEEIKK